MTSIDLEDQPRNQKLVDRWSVLHLGAAAALAVVMPPLWALTLAILWEPFENFLLSPILAHYGILFGRESLQNSVMDLVFDIVGVWIGVYLLAPSLPFLRIIG